MIGVRIPRLGPERKCIQLRPGEWLNEAEWRNQKYFLLGVCVFAFGKHSSSNNSNAVSLKEFMIMARLC